MDALFSERLHNYGNFHIFNFKFSSLQDAINIFAFGTIAYTDEMKVIYKDVVPSIRVEIGEDIHLLSDKRESCVSFSDVEDMVESDHLIVLLLGAV